MTDYTQQRYAQAEAALREAIKEHGSEAAQWVLNAPATDFYSVWGEEIKTLAAEGRVDINMYYTATYRPVTVTTDNQMDEETDMRFKVSQFGSERYGEPPGV